LTCFCPIDFYVRQLRDVKVSVALDKLTSDAFMDYARYCGWALARAHARGGDAAMISGYLGGGDAFDRALGRFAQACEGRIASQAGIGVWNRPRQCCRHA
jgi:uncharacterized protein DUF2252